MYTPDKSIVRQIQNYDPDLFVVWNNRSRYFELRRKRPVGDQLITPITKSIYSSNGPITFTKLDERILWWIYNADGARQGNIRLEMMRRDKRWQQLEVDRRKKLGENFRDFAKDTYSIRAAGLYKKNKGVNRSSKNRYPSFSNYKKKSDWIAPDVQRSTSSRLMTRSGHNARRFFGDTN
jgi:hypothetical protein